MFGLDHWLAFAAASSLIAVIPGPGVANIVGFAVSSGRATASAAIAGAVVGNLVAMTVSLSGAGALLKAYPPAYLVMDFAGSAYLFALGFSAILQRQSNTEFDQSRSHAIPAGLAFTGSVTVSALNPKSLVFFVAFTPQFISPTHSYLVQALVFLATFALIVAVSDTFYALTALRVVKRLSSPAARAWARRSGGVVLIGTSLGTAVAVWGGR